VGDPWFLASTTTIPSVTGTTTNAVRNNRRPLANSAIKQ
jgi:hypothetical protein